jgi:hypothetical protein
VTGAPSPVGADEDHGLRADEWELLREVCGEDRASFHVMSFDEQDR